MCAMKYGSVNGCRWLHTYNSKTCLLHLVCRFRLYFFLFLFHTRKHKHTHANPFLHITRARYFFRRVINCDCIVSNVWTTLFSNANCWCICEPTIQKNGFEGLQDGELRLKNLVHILRLKKNFSPLYAPNSYTFTSNSTQKRPKSMYMAACMVVHLYLCAHKE